MKKIDNAKKRLLQSLLLERGEMTAREIYQSMGFGESKFQQFITTMTFAIAGLYESDSKDGVIVYGINTDCENTFEAERQFFFTGE